MLLLPVPGIEPRASGLPDWIYVVLSYQSIRSTTEAPSSDSLFLALPPKTVYKPKVQMNAVHFRATLLVE